MALPLLTMRMRFWPQTLSVARKFPPDMTLLVSCCKMGGGMQRECSGAGTAQNASYGLAGWLASWLEGRSIFADGRGSKLPTKLLMRYGFLSIEYKHTTLTSVYWNRGTPSWECSSRSLSRCRWRANLSFKTRRFGSESHNADFRAEHKSKKNKRERRARGRLASVGESSAYCIYQPPVPRCGSPPYSDAPSGDTLSVVWSWAQMR